MQKPSFLLRWTLNVSLAVFPPDLVPSTIVGGKRGYSPHIRSPSNPFSKTFLAPFIELVTKSSLKKHRISNCNFTYLIPSQTITMKVSTVLLTGLMASAASAYCIDLWSRYNY
ncbi:hypothetical protein GJ744_003703 [Endocarpon pusillum]|uniref:Uncharacterized protein n=1 Tax=Endocarpon pusillum TaxID=364733 RepID=A0A8H7A8R6_9EURO|nr:hypothetical protein GJ744_003703 [Endocarpon pusillum]